MLLTDDNITARHRACPPLEATKLSAARLSKVHLMLWAACALGFLVDIGEIAITGAIGAIFTAQGQHAASTFALSLLLSSTYIGGAVGAFGFGALVRVAPISRVIGWSMALLSAASLAAALAPGIGWLTVARVLSGLGIGAFPPLAMSLLATHLPPAWRARLSLWASALGTLGGPLIIAITRQLSLRPAGAMAGWQSALLGCAVLAAVLSIAFAWLPVGKDHASTLQAPTADRAITPPDALSTRMILPLVHALLPWAGIGFPMLSGIILLEKGYALKDALLFSAAVMFGPTVGSLVSGLVIDRFVRRDLVVTLLTAGMVSLVVFGFAQTAWLLALSSVVFGIANGVNVPVLSLYVAELFPAPMRAAASGRLWAINRISMAIAPLLLLPLLRVAGPTVLTLTLAAVVAACAALIRFAPPGHAGKELC